MKKLSAFLILALFALGCARPTDYLYVHPAPTPVPSQRPLPHSTPSQIPTPTPLVTPAPKPEPGAPLGALQGHVTSSVDNSALANVTVTIHIGDANGPILATVNTDASGNYAIAILSPGRYAIDFETPSKIPSQGLPTAIYANQTSTLDARLRPKSGDLRGRVTDSSDGRAIADVVVTIHPAGDPSTIITTVRTDSAGNYSVPTLAPGSYTVDFTATNYLPVTGRSVTITAGNMSTLDARLTSTIGGIKGRVSNAVDGRDIQGVTISVHAGNANAPVLQVVNTDANGQYSIPNLPPGTYYLDFTKSGYVPIMAQAVSLPPAQWVTLNKTMTNVILDGQFRVVLMWTDYAPGAVKDVDSYIAIPDLPASQPIGFHFKNYGEDVKLDHDDTDWIGPETITIYNLKSGTYRYYVNNYNVRNDYQALGKSRVIVQLYKGPNLYKTYTVPPGTGVTYEIFQIIDGRVKDIEKYNDNLPVY